MHPLQLLQSALQGTELKLRHEQPSTVAEMEEFPNGYFRCKYGAGDDLPTADLRFAAQNARGGRVGMLMTLPGAPSAGADVTLYEEMGELNVHKYPCSLSRAGTSDRLLIRSQVMTAKLPREQAPYEGPTVAITPKAMELWLEISFSMVGRFLGAFLGVLGYLVKYLGIEAFDPTRYVACISKINIRTLELGASCDCEPCISAPDCCFIAISQIHRLAGHFCGAGICASQARIAEMRTYHAEKQFARCD